MGIGSVIKSLGSVFQGNPSSVSSENQEPGFFTSLIPGRDAKVAFRGDVAALDKEYRSQFEIDVAAYQKIVRT